MALGFGILLACGQFGSVAEPPDDGGTPEGGPASGAAAETAPDGALFFDSAETERCRNWVPNHGVIDPVMSDAGSWYCRFCVTPGQPNPFAYRNFPISIASASASSVYEGDAFVAGDTPDSGLFVFTNLVLDGGYWSSGRTPVRDDETFIQLQVKTSPSTSQTGGTMQIHAADSGCFRFDHAYVLQYPP
jgi:hypothetical protein